MLRCWSNTPNFGGFLGWKLRGWERSHNPPDLLKKNNLVVWLPFFIFPYIGLLIIPIDELIFFGGVNQPPTRNHGYPDQIQKNPAPSRHQILIKLGASVKVMVIGVQKEGLNPCIFPIIEERHETFPSMAIKKRWSISAFFIRHGPNCQAVPCISSFASRDILIIGENLIDIHWWHMLNEK